MPAATPPTARTTLPDATGHFGPYGGIFVPETLMTALAELTAAYEQASQDPAFLEYAYARTPWPRLGTPEDVAALGVFMASDVCRFMTGANVLIDGGFMAY